MPDPSDAPDRPLAAASEAVRAGVVLRSTGSWYTVATETGEQVLARVRGRFRLEQEVLDETNPVAAGDRVRLRTEADGTALITEILPRHNQLSRRAAGRRVSREHVIVANVDFAWGVQAAALPTFNPGFLDRLLVMAEAYHIPAGIVINKADLLRDRADLQDAVFFWRDLYAGLGYPVLLTSALEGDGVGAFRTHLRDKTSVVAGPSGVGKSTLLNTVDPALDLKTGEISQKTRKGTHTTTFATLYPLTDGGYVADTPGLREFGLAGIAPEELSGYFVEMRPFIGECRYPDCTHDHEPGCAVADAVAEGTISEERFSSYLNILDSLRAGAADAGR